MKRIFFIVSTILVLVAAAGCGVTPGASTAAPEVVQFSAMQLQITEILIGYNVPVACEETQPVCDSASPPG